METWMTVEQVCKYLQVEEKWIITQIKHNTFPVHKSHGITRYYRPEVDEWMKMPSPRSGSQRSAKGDNECGDTEIAIHDQASPYSYVYRGIPIKSIY